MIWSIWGDDVVFFVDGDSQDTPSTTPVPNTWFGTFMKHDYPYWVGKLFQ